MLLEFGSVFCGFVFRSLADYICKVTGPPRYAELRANLAQSVQAIGTVVAPVLGSYVFFSTTQDDVAALRNVQWVYLAIAIFVFCLAIVFYFAVIPEVTGKIMVMTAFIVEMNLISLRRCGYGATSRNHACR